MTNVKIKPLPWRQGHLLECIANTPMGQFSVYKHGDIWMCRMPTSPHLGSIDVVESMEAGMKKCQEHLERVLSWYIE